MYDLPLGVTYNLYIKLYQNIPYVLTLLLLITSCPVLANIVDPDQLASSEANWSGSALFVIKYVNFYQKLGSSNLIGWKLEVGVAISLLSSFSLIASVREKWNLAIASICINPYPAE